MKPNKSKPVIDRMVSYEARWTGTKMTRRLNVSQTKAASTGAKTNKRGPGP
jgi:hypothetical protein